MSIKWPHFPWFLGRHKNKFYLLFQCLISKGKQRYAATLRQSERCLSDWSPLRDQGKFLHRKSKNERKNPSMNFEPKQAALFRNQLSSILMQGLWSFKSDKRDERRRQSLLSLSLSSTVTAHMPRHSNIEGLLGVRKWRGKYELMQGKFTDNETTCLTSFTDNGFF
jgi:hypothetical protein